jgi:hypothetical protein
VYILVIFDRGLNILGTCCIPYILKMLAFVEADLKLQEIFLKPVFRLLRVPYTSQEIDVHPVLLYVTVLYDKCAPITCA